MPVSGTENRSQASPENCDSTSTSERDAALLGELDRVGQQIHQHLPQPQRIADQRVGHGAGDVGGKLQRFSPAR